MEITTLSDLKKDGIVEFILKGISVEITPSMIIKGEDRLSYTTMIRLIECCREYHWKNDVMSILFGAHLDSICKSITVDFERPIPVGDKIDIIYDILNVRQKGYKVEFKIIESDSDKLYAKANLVCVFYNPLTQVAISPPNSVLNRLLRLSMEKGKSIQNIQNK